MRRRVIGRGTLAAAVLVLGLAAGASALEDIGKVVSGAGYSRRPFLSRDGRYVAFESSARLAPEDKDRRSDVYMYDRQAKTYRRLPRPEASHGAGGVWLSRDGTMAAYHVADVLAKTNVEPVSTIILYDLSSGRARRLPPPAPGQKQEGEALFPVLGAGGNWVLFTSNAQRLAGTRSMPIRQIFVYDSQDADVRLLSHAESGLPANRPCGEPRATPDGRFVAFLSAATNLPPVLPKKSLAYRLYLLDCASDEIIRVDETSRGIDASNWLPGRFAMDDAGERLVFEARQRKVGKPLDSLETLDLFLFERSSGTVTRLTSGLFAGRSHSPAMSADGRWTAFVFSGVSGQKSDPGGIVVHDRKRNSWRRINTGRCVNPAISADGRWIAFESSDTRFAKDLKGFTRIFVEENPDYEAPRARD